MKVTGIDLNKAFEFHDTSLSSSKLSEAFERLRLILVMTDIEYAYQALSLDEKRATFPPTVWHKTEDNEVSELQQCWFPGTHQNIGGQTEWPLKDTDRGEIGANTFAWMVRCRCKRQQ